MKLIYLKSALKCNSFDVAIGIKILFFRVLVTIEPGRSLLKFVTTNCLKIDFNWTSAVTQQKIYLIWYEPYSLPLNKRKKQNLKINSCGLKKRTLYSLIKAFSSPDKMKISFIFLIYSFPISSCLIIFFIQFHKIRKN